MPNDELLTTEEAALLLGLSHKIICRRIQQNRIEFTKNANGQYFIPRREVTRLLAIDDAKRAYDQQIIELYKSGITLEDVGKKFGMTRQAVRDRLVRAGVSRRGRNENRFTAESTKKEQLEKLYLDDKLSVKKIAAEFSVTIEAIEKMLVFFQIPKRQPIGKKGIIVDILRSLKIGEKGLIECKRKSGYISPERTARRLGIKVSVKKLDINKFEITRIG